MSVQPGVFRNGSHRHLMPKFQNLGQAPRKPELTPKEEVGKICHVLTTEAMKKAGCKGWRGALDPASPDVYRSSNFQKEKHHVGK